MLLYFIRVAAGAPLVITLVPTYHLHNLPLCLHLHWEIIIKSCNCPKYIYCWTNMNTYLLRL